MQAVEDATEVCRLITGSKEVNLMGACAGGLTIAALQGHLQAKRQLRKIGCATYMVSLLDSQVESPPCCSPTSRPWLQIQNTKLEYDVYHDSLTEMNNRQLFGKI